MSDHDTTPANMVPLDLKRLIDPRLIDRAALARVAPNYEAMRNAIAVCERVDEIANLGDQAVAAQAYFRQSQDVDNEMQASRIRCRAERKLGEILKKMAATGERKQQGNAVKSRDATSLDDLGIPKDRASRAMQLADVPQEQFDAALGERRVAQPRRILRDAKPEKTKPRLLVPIDKTLLLWGTVRDYGSKIESGAMPDVKLWRENLQAFQLDHLRRYIPMILDYLTTVQQEIDNSGGEHVGPPVPAPLPNVLEDCRGPKEHRVTALQSIEKLLRDTEPVFRIGFWPLVKARINTIDPAKAAELHGRAAKCRQQFSQLIQILKDRGNL